LSDAAAHRPAPTNPIHAPNDKQIPQLRITALKAKLEKLAKEDRRTLSAYIEKLLEDHVKALLR
jgi:hypothetical protein